MISKDLFICDRDGCEQTFNKSTHNQKYCSDECCKIATNQKIKDKYYAKKDRLSGKKRICANSDCQQSLTMYNEDNICNVCKSRTRDLDRQNLIRMLNVNDS